MKMNLDDIEKRFNNIEDTLETIRDNHLAHIERYTRLTLGGIIISVAVSVSALIITFTGG